MKITRLYTGDNGESHFEDMEIPSEDLKQGGSVSSTTNATGFFFRTTPDNPQADENWHNAPRRQLVVLLSGSRLELEAGDGSIRRFGPGDMFLAEDTTGQGHIRRFLDSEALNSMFITFD